MSNDHGSKIFESAPGTVDLPLGGVDRRLKFRTHELAELEVRRGVGIMSQLSGQNLGLSWLRDAIAVGVAHEFRDRKGKQKERLTERLVSKWIDECESDGIEFDDLMMAVMRAVVGGLPNGKAMLASMDEDEDDGKDEGGDSPPAAAVS